MLPVERTARASGPGGFSVGERPRRKGLADAQWLLALAAAVALVSVVLYPAAVTPPVARPAPEEDGALGSIVPSPGDVGRPVAAADAAGPGGLAERAALLSGFFTQTEGTDGAVHFAYGSGTIRAELSADGIAVQVPRLAATPPASESAPLRGPDAASLSAVDTWSLRIRFPGASPSVPSGVDPLGHRTNYFMGADPSKWIRGAANYREVFYPNLYPGVTLELSGVPAGGLKYEFRVDPGADASVIEVLYEGAPSLSVSKDGSLAVGTAAGDLREDAPVSYYDGGGEARCAFELRSTTSYGFACTDLDPARTLVIDPFVYSTLLGGGVWDRARSVAVDAEGSVYIVGETRSRDFPTTPGALNTSAPGSVNGFVAKVDPTGSTLLYATYLGGGFGDSAVAVAVAPGGEAVVVGSTGSPDFPVTAGAFDTAHSEGTDAFLVRLSADGSGLVYSTLLGGIGDDAAFAVAIDQAGKADVVGQTLSPDFPTTAGALGGSIGGGNDAFLTIVEADGSSLNASTFIGGAAGYEWATGVAADAAGAVLVAGTTGSNDFPTTAGAADTSHAGQGDAFLTKILPGGRSLVFSTFLGGASDDVLESMAMTPDGRVLLAGLTNSSGFPTTPGAFDRQHGGGGGFDAFLTVLNASGAALDYSTFIGGPQDDYGLAVTFEAPDAIVVAGQTFSPEFSTTPLAEQPVFGGASDGFVTRWRIPGPGLVHATFVGGTGTDWVDEVVTLPDDTLYAAGFTASANFTTLPGAPDRSLSGDNDGFAAKLDLGGNPPALAPVGSIGSPARGTSSVGSTLYMGGAAGGVLAAPNGTLLVVSNATGAGGARLAEATFGGALYATPSDAAGGTAFTVFRSTDGGQSWTTAIRDDLSGPVDAFALVAFGSSLFAASCSAFTTGGSAALYRTADGTNWSVVDSAIGKGVCSSQSMIVWRGALYAAFLDGRVMRTTDGSSWEQVALVHAPLTFVDAGQSVFVGTYRGGTIYRSSDGTTWTAHATVPASVETRAGDAWDGAVWWAARAGNGTASSFVMNLTGPTPRNIYVDPGGAIGALAFFDGHLVIGTDAGEVKYTAQVRAAGPQLTLQTAAASPSRPESLILSGLAPSAPTSLRIQDAKGRTVLDASPVADALGRYATAVSSLPTWTSGNYTVLVSAESPDRQLNGSYAWNVLSRFSYAADPALVVEVLRAPTAARAGDPVSFEFALTNNFAANLSCVAVIGWEAPDGTPLSPTVNALVLAPSESRNQTLSVTVPASSPAGAYTGHAMILTDLPSRGGSVLFSIDISLEVG